MGDGLKLSKDKRHRSSSSIAGAPVEGTRSERKLALRGSIPEVDDQFALAEARCDDLQEKIDLIKVVKRKKKFKKRSMTRVNEQPAPPESVPFISVRTQPKKKALQARLRQLEAVPNPARGYVDPETVEQHRMLGQMRGYNQAYTQHATKDKNDNGPFTSRQHRTRPDGDTPMYGRGVQISTGQESADMGTGANDADFSDNDVFDQRPEDFFTAHKSVELCQQDSLRLSPTSRRRSPAQEAAGAKWTDERISRAMPSSAAQRRRLPKGSAPINGSGRGAEPDERSVVELFSKTRGGASPSPDPPVRPQHATERKTKGQSDQARRQVRETQRINKPETADTLEAVSAESIKQTKEARHPRKVKYRTRRYELPTVASQMKQAGVRYYYGDSTHNNIPFVVSKSTAPSHNIGVNLQQVLNGVKIQQPLSGIPATIAHHMGLGHVSAYGAKAPVKTTSENRVINAIMLGTRLVRLPSCKYKNMSYNRLLNLYREGDGMVPRFLRAISRPHYFYTSMYNLATNREDLDGATSKGNGDSQAARQSLVEYASLYREYEQIDKCLRAGGCDPEWERRRDELSRELAAREDHIRKVVQEARKASNEGEAQNLRASASNAEDGYRRQSSYKLNLGDPQQ